MGEALRSSCVLLLGGKQVASIFAMLLHRWLLLREHGGGPEMMTKHVHILLSGTFCAVDTFLYIASGPVLTFLSSVKMRNASCLAVCCCSFAAWVL